MIRLIYPSFGAAMWQPGPRQLNFEGDGMSRRQSRRGRSRVDDELLVGVNSVMKLVRLGRLAAFNPSQNRGSSRGVWIRIELGAARGSKRSNWGGLSTRSQLQPSLRWAGIMWVVRE